MLGTTFEPFALLFADMQAILVNPRTYVLLRQMMHLDATDVRLMRLRKKISLTPFTQRRRSKPLSTRLGSTTNSNTVWSTATRSSMPAQPHRLSARAWQRLSPDRLSSTSQSSAPLSLASTLRSHGSRALRKPTPCNAPSACQHPILSPPRRQRPPHLLPMRIRPS